MNQYNILQAIYMSFYSKDLYRDVAKRWGAKAFLYLLVLIALSWIISIFQIQFSINEAYKRNSNRIVDQIPVLTVQNGEFKTPENKPYIIVDPDTKEKIAVIDTSGQYKTLTEAGTGILVTKTELISQPKANEVRTYQVPANMNMTINAQSINQYIQKYLWVIWIFLFITFTIGAFIYRLVQALIYAIFGKIFSAMSHVPLTYEEILQIAMVAITPTIIITTIFDFLLVKFPFQALFYFLLSMAYLIFGIKANKTTSLEKIKADSDDKSI